MESAELEQWLLRHTPSDAREAGHLARMRTLLTQSRPFDRHAFTPGHFTASAFVRTEDLRSVLLIHHRKLGIWVQPGGHIEAGDASARAAAEREVHEETGLSGLLPGGRLELGPLFDVDVHPIPGRPNEPAHEHFDLRFSFVARASASVVASAEVQAARWVRLDEVRSLTTDESVLRAIRKFDSLE